ncbi:MAG TPA: hypothetical protein DF480_07425 [Clostridiales bacterium]|nr:hypothetical protein [Clostridiales bacterium]
MPVKIILLTALGFLFLGMAAIGLLLPIWPTTPFVLVSVACFSSTPRIKAQIMRIAFFREHIENYENRTGLSLKTTRISLIWLWGMLFLSVAVTQNIKLAALLLLIGIAVTVHILWMARAKD